VVNGRHFGTFTCVSAQMLIAALGRLPGRHGRTIGIHGHGTGRQNSGTEDQCDQQ